jgi:hypothetical protein
VTTFNFGDHPGRYPLIIYTIVKDAKLNRVLLEGGSSLNLLFLKIFDQMGLPRSLLHPSRAPFHGIVPGTAATPIGQISLPVTFGTRENFRIENIQFEVADFETAYNAFLGWPAFTKFMAIPHYAYLVLKVPGLHGVISIRGDVKRAYDCDKRSCEMADKLTASVELWELKESLAESPPPHTRSSPTSRLPRCPSSRRTHSASRYRCLWRNHGSHIGTHTHQIPLENRDIFAWKPANMPGVPRELIEHELHWTHTPSPSSNN